MGFGHFFQVPVNYFAVLISAIAAMILGYIWYGPLFGERWRKLVGVKDEKQKKGQGNMGSMYGIMFVCSFIMAYFVFHFIWYAAPGSYNLFIALKTSFYAWLGLIATAYLAKHVVAPEKKPLQLYFIETGYYLISLLAMGVIFSLIH